MYVRSHLSKNESGKGDKKTLCCFVRHGIMYPCDFAIGTTFMKRNVTKIPPKLDEKLEQVLIRQFIHEVIVVNLFTTILCITCNNKFKVTKFINLLDRVKRALKTIHIEHRLT